jgi:hypothetical protein
MGIPLKVSTLLLFPDGGVNVVEEHESLDVCISVKMNQAIKWLGTMGYGVEYSTAIRNITL